MKTPTKITILGITIVIAIVLIALPTKPVRTLENFYQLSKDCGSSKIYIDKSERVVHCDTKDFELQITLEAYNQYLDEKAKRQDMEKRKADPRQPDKRWGISPAESKVVVLQMCRLNGVISESHIKEEFYGIARRTGTSLMRIMVWADAAKNDYKNLYDFERRRYRGSICRW